MPRPLLISHDLSLSGAPIALLELAKALQRLGENPIVVSLFDGPLAKIYLESGIAIARTTKINPFDISFVIANTFISVPTALRFKKYGTPIAAWIHEPEYYLREQEISPQTLGLHELDVSLAPAKFQLIELEPFLRPGSAYQFRNMVRQHWFRLPGDESMLAVCGDWQTRKGQAQLLELVRRSDTRCRFKFIGATRPNSDPDADIGAASHAFLGLIDPERAKIEIAKSGALVSCATYEVQPLSAIEALMAGRPVLLSGIAAHRELARLVPNVYLFDQSSPQSFREGYARLRDAMPDVELASRASGVANALFGQSAFDRRLADILKVLGAGGSLLAGIKHYQDT